MRVPDHELAIRGGRPIRPERRGPRITVSDAAKRDVADVLDSGALNQFYGGTRVRTLERAFAAAFGATAGVACCSGTAALHLAYLALDLPPHSEVLLPANAYVSAVSAALQSDVVPVLVDIDPATWSMDLDDLRSKVGARTSAIVAVHMWGQPNPMTDVVAIADRGGAVVIEDCAEAAGARWAGRFVGSFGAAACYSLCCYKHISAGEGGMLLAADEATAEHARRLAHKGKGTDFFDYRELGFSYGMTEVAAVLATHALAGAEGDRAARARNASALRTQLDDLPLEFETVVPEAEHAWFRFSFLLPGELAACRNWFVDAVRAEGADAIAAHPHLGTIGWLREHHPRAFHHAGVERLPEYAPEATPVAADVTARQVCIEVGPNLDEDDMVVAAEAVRKVLAAALDEAGA